MIEAIEQIEEMEGKETPQVEENLSEGLQKTQENPMTVELEKEEEKKNKNEQEQGRICALRACKKCKKTL